MKKELPEKKELRYPKLKFQTKIAQEYYEQTIQHIFSDLNDSAAVIKQEVKTADIAWISLTEQKYILINNAIKTAYEIDNAERMLRSSVTLLSILLNNDKGLIK